MNILFGGSVLWPIVIDILVLERLGAWGHLTNQDGDTAGDFPIRTLDGGAIGLLNLGRAAS